MHHAVQMHTMDLLKIWLKDDFILKMRLNPQILSITK